MWSIQFSKIAHNDLIKLDGKIRLRVLNKIQWLRSGFNELYHESLRGEFAGLIKLRVGDWRIVYQIQKEKSVILVHRVEHRSKVYRRK